LEEHRSCGLARGFAACCLLCCDRDSCLQIPHFEVTIESLIHVLIRNDPRKENRNFIRCFILKTIRFSFNEPPTLYEYAWTQQLNQQHRMTSTT